MKKTGFFVVPIIMILMFTVVMPRIFNGGMSSSSIIIIAVGMIAALFLFRPKKAATKSAEAVADEVLDDYCRDAFADNEVLNGKFLAALSDIGNNCPKLAVSKLEKLEGQCPQPKEKYAVAMAAALAYRNQQDLKGAVREYNKAVVIHPTGKLAYAIGEAHQRMGNLDKAMDSYEFAIELEPNNPKYYSSIGTACVGDGDYSKAMDYAMDALELDDKFPQALATMSICYSLKDDALMYKHYLKLAVENGYKEEKILDTIKALKRRR